MAVKKKAAKKKTSWGGKRTGAGRPLGSIKPQNPNARRHHIGLMVNAAELKALKAEAKRAGIPVATLAHRIVVSR